MIRTMLAVYLLGGSAVALAQDFSPEFRQFQVAASFQGCTENTLRFVVTELKTKPPAATAAQIEGIVWNTILDTCQSHITSDKARGLILLHYRGDMSKAKGFEEGIVWASRAYVAGVVADSGLGTDGGRSARKPAPQM